MEIELTEEQKDIILQFIYDELHDFRPEQDNAAHYRYKANLLEIKQILEGGNIQIFDEHRIKRGKWKENFNPPKKRGRPRKEKESGAKKEKKGSGRYKAWPAEVEQFVRKAKKTMTVREMADEINRRFNLGTDNRKLSKWMWAHGIKSEVHRRGKKRTEDIKPERMGKELQETKKEEDAISEEDLSEIEE